MSRFRRLKQFSDDTIIPFLKIMGWFMVPVAFALMGLVLLTSIPTALVWVASIVVFALLYVRFSDRHTEHTEFDDRLEAERWEEGKEKYFKLLEKDEKKGEEKK